MKTCNKKHHYLYKIINVINQKYYIGRHSTDNIDDGYMGSGYALIRAQKKYGIENFQKIILENCDSYDELVRREIEIVNELIIADELSYNIALGGEGGYTNYSKKFFLTEEQKAKISKANKGRLRPDARETIYKIGFHKIWDGRKRTEADRKNKSLKARENMENGKNPFSNKITCPHCNSEGDKGNMMRWHFDNCKKVKQ